MAILAIIALGACAVTAQAADVSIKGNASEFLQGSNNYFLLSSPSGPLIASTTSGALDILAQTPTTNYLLDARASYYNYFGPGTADTTLTWGTPANASFSIDHTELLDKFNFIASWSRVDTATTSLAQTGVASGHGSTNYYSAGGGVIHDLGRIDTVSLNALASYTTFTAQNSFPYVDVTSTAAWTHNLSSTTTLNNLVIFDWFSEDDRAQSQRLFWKLFTGLNSQLSSRLTFSGRLGWGFVNSYQTAGTQTVNASIPGLLAAVNSATMGGIPFVPQTGSGNSILGDAIVTYQLLGTTRLSLTAAQAVSPTQFGQLQKSDTIGLTIAHDINRHSNLSFSANFTYVPAAPGNAIFGTNQSGSQSGASEFFSASVNYSFQLTREWRTSLSYAYLQSNGTAGISGIPGISGITGISSTTGINGSSGNARSSIVSFTLSRDFTLMGNPTAINQAEREKARERQQQSIGYVFPTLY
jgi:hypothetical protein